MCWQDQLVLEDAVDGAAREHLGAAFAGQDLGDGEAADDSALASQLDEATAGVHGATLRQDVIHQDDALALDEVAVDLDGVRAVLLLVRDGEDTTRRGRKLAGLPEHDEADAEPLSERATDGEAAGLEASDDGGAAVGLDLPTLDDDVHLVDDGLEAIGIGEERPDVEERHTLVIDDRDEGSEFGVVHVRWSPFFSRRSLLPHGPHRRCDSRCRRGSTSREWLWRGAVRSSGTGCDPCTSSRSPGRAGLSR